MASCTTQDSAPFPQYRYMHISFSLICKAIIENECCTLYFLHIILELYFPLEMSEVLKSLEQVVYKWFDLGLQLGLSDGVLHAIEHDYHRIGERKREMVWKWMNSAAFNPTWCSLANALHAIDMRVVAEKVSVEHRKTYCCPTTMFRVVFSF